MEYKVCGLAADSIYYYSKASVYQRFAEAEDAPGRVARRLTRLLRGKQVLDLGCGTGKYAALLSPFVRSYTGVDLSAEALAIARSKCGGRERFICTAAQRLPLPAASLDAVFACWVFGTMADAAARSAALAECRRVLRPAGAVYLIENDIGGEFEAVRGRHPDSRRTAAYNDELLDRGFQPVSRFETSFGFVSTAEARSIFETIWGPQAAQRIRGANVRHQVVIFRAGRDRL